MDTARETDQRLRSGLNADQASRERLCLALLGIDRSYSDPMPRRPEGGPDGSRDIECKWLGKKCFGAVGFINNVSDSPDDKREIKKKFRSDVDAAHAVDGEVKAFVFFCNVDLPPAEVRDLKAYAEGREFTHVDIYWRERLRHVLCSPEGLAFRFQYLGMELSSAEQSAFFARYGKDLEDMVRGRFDRIELKLDSLEFFRWKSGAIRSLHLELLLRQPIQWRTNSPKHFRFCLDLQAAKHENRSIILGARDDYRENQEGSYTFKTKAFYWQENANLKIENSWTPQPVWMSGGEPPRRISANVAWKPRSPIPCEAFEGLAAHLHFSENIRSEIARVRFSIDDYLFVDSGIDKEDTFAHEGIVQPCPPSGWPENLSKEDGKVEWCMAHLGWIRMDAPPPMDP